VDCAGDPRRFFFRRRDEVPGCNEPEEYGMKRVRGMRVGIVLALLVAMFFVFRPDRPAPVVQVGSRAGTVHPRRAAGGGKKSSARASVSATNGAARAGGGGAIATKPAVVDPYAVVARLQNLLDVGDFDAALAEARRRMKHSDVTVRREVLFAFHWIGEAAIPDMARMMVDPDPDLADQAAVFFGQAVENCDGTVRRANALALAADVASKQALDQVLQMLVGLPEPCAAPPILKLLASDDPEVVAKAQDALRFLSGGETYTNAAEWDAWYRQLPPQEPDPVIETVTIQWKTPPAGAPAPR
jgi:hypothetical protein